MGSWGFESCSNDYTWDYLYAKDIHNMTQKECNDSIRETWDCKYKPDKEVKLGVVIWILCQAKKVAMDKLEEALEIAEKLIIPKELKKSGYIDLEKRENCLKNEIALIKYAIKNKGKGKEIYIRGLFEKLENIEEEREQWILE